MNHHLILGIWRTMVVIVGAQSTTPWTCSEEHGVLAIIRWCSCPYCLQHVIRVLVTPSSAISDATVANPFVYKALRSPSGVWGLLIARTVRTRFAFLSFERGAHWLMDVNGVYKPRNITGGTILYSQVWWLASRHQNKSTDLTKAQIIQCGAPSSESLSWCNSSPHEY